MAMESNLEQMAAFFAGAPTQLRPHDKNQKCVALARRQLAQGVIGITCATLGEAEALAGRGIQGILLANEIVEAIRDRTLRPALADNRHYGWAGQCTNVESARCS